MFRADRVAFQDNLNVAINDGTQRLTIRWTPKDKLHHSQRPQEWTSAAMKVLKEILTGNSGVAYRWESRDLATWKSIDDMDESEIREYLSPQITYLASSGMYIFGLRFGFTKFNPVEWQSSEQTKEAMRRHNVWVTVSNSSCHGGKLVYAGFILMKAPNSTHKVRYLQSLRNRLPVNTPFFDIVLLKKTPLEQSIHHLAIQCGENHVATLSKSLSMILNGPGGAVFLPRLVLGSLQSDQIRQYFDTHDKYLKSLRSITMSPLVTNLDTIRKELFPNGESVERSTREWATQLKLPSGDSAMCDIVNGGKDRITRMLVPQHFYQTVLNEVASYKLRLNPMERREARFRDSIPGLPEVIQIDTSVRQSLDYLEKIATEEIWKPTASADSASTNSRQPTNQSGVTANVWHRQGRESGSIASNLTNLSGTTDRFPRLSSKRAPASSTNQKESEAATVSTHSAMTPSVVSNNMQRYNMLEAQLKKQQDALDQGLRTSEERMSAMEKKLDQLERLDELESKMVTSMGYHVDTNTTLSVLTRQMDTMMQMMNRLTQPCTQSEESPKPAREITSTTRVQRFNSKKAVRETAGISRCSSSFNSSSPDIPHQDSAPTHGDSPKKKKQRPEQDDTSRMNSSMDYESEDVEMQCDTQMQVVSSDMKGSSDSNQQSVLDRTDSEMTTSAQRRLTYDVDSEISTQQTISSMLTTQLTDARSTILPESPPRTDVYPIFLPREAPTDLEDQYTTHLFPDGGAPD